MSSHRVGSLVFLLLVLFVLASSAVLAQTAPWTGVLRGSWVQTGAAALGDVTLAGRGNGCQIVVADDENAAVRQAAEFLAGDIEKISGFRPPIAKEADANRVAIHMVTLGHGAIPAAVNAAPMQGQWESYRIFAADNAVWLVGSNPRGTAFAAYTLSERLGIDPIYIWSGYAPEHRDPLIMKRTSFSQGPPAFKYRGFFHDDEDLLGRPFDPLTGYPSQLGDVSLDWYKRFFETALRLKMNMVAPYTRVHRRYEVQKLASDWGLYYTSHHYDILVSNPFGLTRYNLAAERGIKPVYDWFTNKDGMLAYWRAGVVENKDIDVIWPVGMRGTEDRPFTFPQGTTEAQRAATFREVIADQVGMVKESIPKDKTPLFHFTMYSEMLPAYQTNPAAFDLPTDVIIVWPDDNDGHMRGLPTSVGRWKHGVYYHLAYLGGNLSKQLTHVVAPATVAEQFDKIVKAGATEYMLVNMSEVRDYVMCGRMLADIVWDAPAIYATPEATAGAAQRYTDWWSREYFQSSSATAKPAQAVADAYSKYFGVIDTPASLWQAEDLITSLLQKLYGKVAGQTPPPTDPNVISQLQAREAKLEEALAAETQAEVGRSMSQQRFLSVDVALGLRTAQRQTAAALKLNDALSAPDAGRLWQLAGEAFTSLEQLETGLRRAEYPPFDRWYQESWIRSANSTNNPHRAYVQVRAFMASEGKGPAPAGAPGGRGRGGPPAGPATPAPGGRGQQGRN